jgi:chemosensory pili system protein ChpA (sensor histidine kinase/response regulator)
MAVGTIDDLAAHSLDLVNRELASTLDAARRELEDYVDGHSGRDSLLRAAELLHLARGALKIVEIHGAALLAEEMERACRRFAQGGDHAQSEQGIEALTRAMVQLPAYLERLLSGGKDVALVLLPLLNDLREACDKPSLSEGTLLLLNTGPFERHLHARPAAAVVGTGREFERVAQRLRPAFQTALLGWIRGLDVARNVDDLLKVSVALEKAAATDPVRQLWSVLAAVLTAIRGEGLEATVALKRLIGQADRQLKRLIDGGEPALVDTPPVDLINNLLYYVARASSDTERIRAVRETYNLSDMLPGEEQLEEARENLAGPSVKLMRTVAQAIKEDLSAVKDVLDIFVRTGMRDVAPLGPQLDMLKKISDTLGVLGLEKARAQIQTETDDLSAVITAGSIPDPAMLERVAATLLDVEDALDRELVRAVLPEGADARHEPDDETQQRHVTQAVMGECMVNLAKIKEAVIQLVDRPGDVRALDLVKPQLRGIVAGLLMLNKTKVMKVVERIGEVIASRLAPSGAALRPEHLERLADAIVSVEYYMETVSAGRSDPWYMLENAERCLDLLESLPAARLVRISPAEAPEAPSAPPPQPPSVMQVDEERSDPELVEIFIEEAKEEIANIQQYLPAWTENLQNSEALISVRRSFHTLKGSGRMVGAQLIGEFSWSIENLLNRLINQTLEITAPMLEFLAEAATAVPQLIEQLEVGLAPTADVQLLMKRAEAFAEGDPEAASLTSQSVRVPELPDGAAATGGPAADAQPPGMDPVLAEIFVKEMRSHLDVIRAYIAQADAAIEQQAVEEPLYRACHTLLGSARMAGFEPVMTLAAPLAEHLRRHYEAGSGLRRDGVAVLRRVADEIEQMANSLAAGGQYLPNAELPAALAALAPQTAEAAAAESVSPAPRAAEGDVFDPEIAAIFAEEAAEILDSAEAALQQLRQNRDPAALIELQRFLHTLKGGARMAGIAAMGDLSHALETLLADIAAGRLPADGPTIDAAQRCVDHLHHLRETIETGHVAHANALLAELESMHAAASGAEPLAAAPGPAAPPPSVAAEAAAAPEPGVAAQTAAVPEPGVAAEAAVAEEAAVAPPAAAEASAAPADAQEAQSADRPDLEATSSLEFTEAELAELEAIDITGTQRQPDELEATEEPTVEEELVLDGAALAEAAEPSLAAAAPPLEPEAPLSEALSPMTPPFAAEPPAEPLPEEPQLEEPLPEAPMVEVALTEATAAISAPEAPSVSVPPAAAATPPAAAAELRSAERTETARVDAALLDALLNGAGEINIFQSRLNQQLHSIEFHLGELGQTVSRLREQLRKLEAETEAQILHRHQDDLITDGDFDPLELDRYSTIQQLSRALAESANDVASINELLHGLTTETDTLLTQQARVTAELQDGLMQTRMVPFQRHVARLARIVRQACIDTRKSAELVVEGENSELDRQVLESMLPPFEHLLRNCVAHGIEDPVTRQRKGKPETGRVHLKLKREGAEVLIEVSDDGAGLNFQAIRRKAYEQGLIAENQQITDEQAIELILQPGFSTAGELTQAAGRGVGMDVVDSEVKKLGGSLRVESTAGEGTRFLIRLPYTLAITHALIVNVGDETFALPLPTVEGITRVSREKMLAHLTQDDPKLEYGGVGYKIQHLGGLVGAAPSALPEEESAVSLVLVRAGDNSAALLTDSLEGSREIVVKTLGPHIASVQGVTGATILGDGRVIMILDAATLVRAQRGGDLIAPIAPPVERQLTALVVDDSITMRRVTQRLLERRGVRVLTARDGLDAITVMQEHEVDIILLDIEMPRMDGYQFATHVRNDVKAKDTPIIMITSRSGEKHRAKAIEIGVNDYLSKPYQESQLVAAIEALLGKELR